ncbi:MAG: GNAT family N-acetyltransferase [Chromatiales bacterium]|nr:GNAT family N-acetyltransferase [Chromatiales bacterium]
MHPLPEQIDTRRLRLRRPEPADAEVIYAAYAQDPLVCRYLAWSSHESVAVTHGFIAECLAGWAAGTPLPYVIADPRTNAAIGMIEARIRSTTIDIGYVLARSRWGGGLMPEAIEALAGASLTCPAIFRVQAICDVENHASIRALEKSGFTREGRLERYGIHPNVSPEPRAVFMYARVR